GLSCARIRLGSASKRNSRIRCCGSGWISERRDWQTGNVELYTALPSRCTSKTRESPLAQAPNQCQTTSLGAEVRACPDRGTAASGNASDEKGKSSQRAVGRWVMTVVCG